MVKTVILVRHGKSQPLQNGCEDASRPLTPAGMRAIRATYPKVFALLESPDTRIWTSPYRRAFQTAEVISQVIGDENIEGHYSLTRSNPDEFLGELSRCKADTVVAVGHHDFMEQISCDLLGFSLPFSWGTVAAIALTDAPAGAQTDSQEAFGLHGELLWFCKGPDWQRWKVLQRMSEDIAQTADAFSRAAAAAFSGDMDADLLEDIRKKTDALRAFLSFVRPFARERRVAEIIEYLDDLLAETDRLHSYDVLCREISARRSAVPDRLTSILGSGLTRPERPLTLEEELSAPDPQPTLYEHACQVRAEAWERMRRAAHAKKEVKRFNGFIEKAEELKWRRHVEESGLSGDMLCRRYQDLIKDLSGEWEVVRLGDRKAVLRLRLSIERVQVIGAYLSALVGKPAAPMPTGLAEAYPAIRELCNVRTMRTILAHWDMSELLGEATYQMVSLDAQLSEQEDRLVAGLEAAHSDR